MTSGQIAECSLLGASRPLTKTIRLYWHRSAPRSLQLSSASSQIVCQLRYTSDVHPLYYCTLSFTAHDTCLILSNLRLPSECGLICVTHTPVAQTVDYICTCGVYQLEAVKKQTCSQKVTGFSVDWDNTLSFASDPAGRQIHLRTSAIRPLGTTH